MKSFCPRNTARGMARNLLITGATSLIIGSFVVGGALLAPRQQPPASAYPEDGIEVAGQILTSPSGDAQERTPQQSQRGLVLFREQIRPLLIAKCLECHRPEQADGGLDLSSRQAALEGGDSGPAIVPGEPEQSLVYQLVTAFEMPPDLKNLLSSVETAALKQWIELQAPYDREPLSVDEGQSSGSRRSPIEAMMCPCMKMMMNATRGTKALPLASPLAKDQAGERAKHYLESLGNPRLRIGQINEAATSYEAQVLTQEGSLANWIIVDKRTGELKMLY